MTLRVLSSCPWPLQSHRQAQGRYLGLIPALQPGTARVYTGEHLREKSCAGTWCWLCVEMHKKPAEERAGQGRGGQGRGCWVPQAQSPEPAQPLLPEPPAAQALQGHRDSTWDTSGTHLGHPLHPALNTPGTPG